MIRSLTFRWTCLAAFLLMLLSGCIADNSHIPSASTAATALNSGSGSVTLTWDRVMAETFDLYLAAVPGAAESSQKIPNVANPFQISDLRIGATYYFVLSAINGQKISLQTKEFSHTVSITDDRIHLPFESKTSEITLAWDDTEEAVAYNLYWRSSPGVTRQTGIKIPKVQNPHTLKGLIPGATYYFVITAVGKSGAESGVSEEIVHRAK